MRSRKRKRPGNETSAGVRGVAAQHCGGIRLSVNVNSHVTFGKDGPAACYPSEEGVPGDSDE